MHSSWKSRGGGVLVFFGKFFWRGTWGCEKISGGGSFLLHFYVEVFKNLYTGFMRCPPPPPLCASMNRKHVLKEIILILHIALCVDHAKMIFFKISINSFQITRLGASLRSSATSPARSWSPASCAATTRTTGRLWPRWRQRPARMPSSSTCPVLTEWVSSFLNI